jgi:hypothetical protein
MLKYKDVTIEIQRVWNVRSKNDTSNNRGNWGHLKIIKILPEQHSGKALDQRTTENSHTGHCTHTSESADVNVRNIQHGK